MQVGVEARPLSGRATAERILLSPAQKNGRAPLSEISHATAPLRSAVGHRLTPAQKRRALSRPDHRRVLPAAAT